MESDQKEVCTFSTNTRVYLIYHYRTVHGASFCEPKIVEELERHWLQDMTFMTKCR